ncbi:MAG: response regulator [Myxococcales bacterium]|nr:response regulator [Myxococcales bacterium]
MTPLDRFLADARPLLDAARAATPQAAADPLQALALDAAVLVMPELAELATAMVRASARASADELAPAFAALDGALDALANADESGARYDAAALRALAHALGGARPAIPPPPRAAAAEPDDSAWEPSVDEDMIDPFLEESRERLESVAAQLLALERSPDDAEIVRALFRDLHTLKGSSGFVGLKKMARVAHHAEDLVGQVRDRKRAVDRGVIDVLLATVDVLGAILERASARAHLDVDVAPVLARLLDPSAGAPPASSRELAAPPPSADETSPAAPKAQSTLRIDFAKLDLLLDLVGELVLAKGKLGTGLADLGMLTRELDVQRRRGFGRRGRRAPLAREDVAEELGRLQRVFDDLRQDLEGAQRGLEGVSGQLRDQVMKLRMVPVGRGWARYPRTIRQLAQQLGKEVVLETRGEDVELDKVLVEQLDDPLMHLIRNAIDHGLESPDAREAAGKAREGTLRLAAHHRGSQVVLSLSDDGGGIDAAKVRRRAVERGLLDEARAASLTDAQAVDLIFAPGFSTAERVSDVSGRGVGMDVVRETITRLKGTVHVESRQGRGTTFELRLPLTLAIVQVLLVRVAGQTLAIPLDLVRRTLALPPRDIRLTGSRETILDEGAEVPLLRLGELLGWNEAAGELPDELPIILADLGKRVVAFACDGFLGRQEVVLKTLGTLLRRVPGAAGATLVGDRPVLVLDLPSLVNLSQSHGRGMPTRPTPGLGGATATGQAGGARRVLIVEDADVIRESLRRAFEAGGYVVTTARDGEEGLSRARAEAFDLVTTDVVMPRLDGYGLTRRLRALDAYRDVPIVMVTSKADRIDRVRGFDAGVDAYVTKPTDTAEILRIAERLLAAR